MALSSSMLGFAEDAEQQPLAFRRSKMIAFFPRRNLEFSTLIQYPNISHSEQKSPLIIGQHVIDIR